MGTLSNSLNNYFQKFHFNGLEGSGSSDEIIDKKTGEVDYSKFIESEKDNITTDQKNAITNAFQQIILRENCGLIKGKKILLDTVSGLQIKCSALGRMILPKELAAFKNNVLTYEQFKSRNGLEAASLFTEIEKEQFRLKIADILKQTTPGLAKAIEIFGDNMCSQMGIGQQFIASIIIPFEIEALNIGRINYPNFLKRNTYYAFDSMTERELQIVREAFLLQGESALVSKAFEIDRQIFLESN